jgi:hypothetical protein
MKSKKYRQSAIQVAKECLLSGNVKKYCELMFICEEFDAALAVAPSVSYAFWQSLSLAKAQLVDEEAKEILLYTGQPLKAIDTLIEEGCYDSAMLVAASLRKNSFLPKTKSVRVKNEKRTEEDDFPFIKDDYTSSDFQLYSIASERSIRFAKEGMPLLSATSLLCVGNVDGAIWRLIHCGELVWAIDLAKATDKYDDKIAALTFRYCAYHGKGFEAFRQLSPSLKRSLAPLLITKGEIELEQLYKENGMKSIQEYASRVKKNDPLTLIQSNMLTGNIDEGILITVDCLNKIMLSDSFDFCEAEKYVTFIRNAASHVDVTKQQWLKAVAICHYFGIYYAFWHGYGIVAPTIFYAYKAIVDSTDEEFLKKHVADAEFVTVLALIQYNKEKAEEFMQKNGIETNDMFQAAFDVKKNASKIDGGSTVVTASSGMSPVDIDFDPLYSVCSGEIITGNPFIFEDTKTRMTLDEAFMYFESTPFSPLETSKYIVPF